MARLTEQAISNCMVVTAAVTAKDGSKGTSPIETSAFGVTVCDPGH